MSDNIMVAIFIFQLVLFPLQGLLFLATRRERERMQVAIRDGLQQALRVIVTRR